MDRHRVRSTASRWANSSAGRARSTTCGRHASAWSCWTCWRRRTARASRTVSSARARCSCASQGSVVVTGFGLAGATLAPRLSAPSYASPEQARDERIGPAADLWALGAILYTMVEGRPPFRDRDRPEATLKGVDRLPLRAPVRAGPLTQTVQGLLRKDSRERLTRPAVRERAPRVLNEDPDATAGGRTPVPAARSCTAWPRAASSRTLVAGTALAVVTVAAAVLAVTKPLPGTATGSDDRRGARPVRSASAVRARRPPRRRRPSPSAPRPAAAPTQLARAHAVAPTPTPTPTHGLPHRGHGPAARIQRLPLPRGLLRRPARGLEAAGAPSARATWRTASPSAPPATRARSPSPTASRVGTDPVAVWRDDVEPGLEDRRTASSGSATIRATTYQGHKAADMQWIEDVDGTRVRTFGRGFLIGRAAATHCAGRPRRPTGTTPPTRGAGHLPEQTFGGHD